MVAAPMYAASKIIALERIVSTRTFWRESGWRLIRFAPI